MRRRLSCFGTQEVGFPFEEFGVDLPGDEVGVPDNAREKRNRGGNTFENEAVERLPHAAERLFPHVSVYDDFRQKRVVEGRHGVSRVDMCINPYTWPAGRMVCGDEPGTGLKVPVWILGVDTAFDGVSPEAPPITLETDRLA